MSERKRKHSLFKVSLIIPECLEGLLERDRTDFLLSPLAGSAYICKRMQFNLKTLSPTHVRLTQHLFIGEWRQCLNLTLHLSFLSSMKSVVQRRDCNGDLLEVER